MALNVSPATPAEWPAAGRVLFAASPDPGPATARFLGLIASEAIEPQGIFLARDGGEIRGALLAQRLAGAQGSVWPPAVTVNEESDVEDALTSSALRWLWAGGVKVVQAVVHADEPGIPALVRAGLSRITELVFLARDLTARVAVPPVSNLIVEAYSAANATAFAKVLLDSYDGTLDCPELNDTRSIDEVIAGYRDARTGGARDWFLVSEAGMPVAVLMLAGPLIGPWVLTYLGLIPAARGRGIGRALTRTVIRRAAAAEAPRLTLNVDVRNTPALRLYASEGFAEYDRRDVYLVIGAKSSLE